MAMKIYEELDLCGNGIKNTKIDASCIENLPAQKTKLSEFEDDLTKYATVETVEAKADKTSVYSKEDAETVLAKKAEIPSNPMTLFGVFNTKAELDEATGMVEGSTAIVKQDETNSNKTMTYIFTETWKEVAEFDLAVRDFTVDKLNLATEATGILGQGNMDLTGIAKESQLVEYAKKTELFSGNYEDLENLPTIPSKVSDLAQDVGYLTASDITGKADADKVYSKEEADTTFAKQEDIFIVNPSVFTFTVEGEISSKVIQHNRGTDYGETYGYPSVHAFNTTTGEVEVFKVTYADANTLTISSGSHKLTSGDVYRITLI